MTTIEILKGYGYEERNGALWTGAGSLVAGFTCTIRVEGENSYVVDYKRWAYDCDGEEVDYGVAHLNLDLAGLWEFVCDKRPLIGQ